MFIFGSAVDRSAFSSGIDNNMPSKRTTNSTTKNRRDSSSVIKPKIVTQATTCCNCFGAIKMQRTESTSGQMSEVYCRMCDDDVDSPACLINVSNKARTNSDGCRPKHKTILTVESELEMTTSKVSMSPHKSPIRIDIATSKFNDECRQQQLTETRIGTNAKSKQIIMTDCSKMENDTVATIGEEYELADDAIVCDDDDIDADHEIRIVCSLDRDKMIRVQGKEELPVTPEEQIQCNISDNNSDNSGNNSSSSGSSSNNSSVEHLCKQNPSKQENICHPDGTERIDKPTNTSNDYISHENDAENQLQCNGKLSVKKVNCTDNHPLLMTQSSEDDLDSDLKLKHHKLRDHEDLNGNDSIKFLRQMHRIYSTLPKAKKASAMQKMIIQNDRLLKSVPKRITPDGTTIYYWCDLPNIVKG